MCSNLEYIKNRKSYNDVILCNIDNVISTMCSAINKLENLLGYCESKQPNQTLDEYAVSSFSCSQKLILDTLKTFTDLLVGDELRMEEYLTSDLLKHVPPFAVDECDKVYVTCYGKIPWALTPADAQKAVCDISDIFSDVFSDVCSKMGGFENVYVNCDCDVSYDNGNNDNENFKITWAEFCYCLCLIIKSNKRLLGYMNLIKISSNDDKRYFENELCFKKNIDPHYKICKTNKSSCC